MLQLKCCHMLPQPEMQWKEGIRKRRLAGKRTKSAFPGLMRLLMTSSMAGFTLWETLMTISNALAWNAQTDIYYMDKGSAASTLTT